LEQKTILKIQGLTYFFTLIQKPIAKQAPTPSFGRQIGHCILPAGRQVNAINYLFD